MVGYKVKTVSDNVPANFICFFCHLLMRETIQTCRGERSCKECYKEKQRHVGPGICPIDKEGNTTIFPDKYADKEIGKIECYCPNEKFGCQQILKIQLLETHLKNCEFFIYLCQQCHLEIPLKDQEHHQAYTCLKRNVTCPYCEDGLIFDQLQDHLKTCIARPPVCAYGCGSVLAVGFLNAEHAKSCPKILSKEACVFKVLGCENELSHEQNHGIYVTCKLELQEKENIELKKEVLRLKNENVATEQKMYQKDVEYQRRMDEMERKLLIITEHQSLQFTNIQERMNRLEVKKVSNASSALDSQAITDCVAKFEHLDSTFTVLSKNVSDVDLKQQLLENTCYGDQFIWKVDKLDHRMNQAIIGRVTTLHSAPCFTKRFGYKYCLRLYLNGDGLGKGTHLSLFFVIMKSEYDALLTWPFRERVTFKLRHFDDPSKSIKESFSPDANSSSFKRPIRDMNVAAGCPMFASLETLKVRTDYIRENALFIETIIG